MFAQPSPRRDAEAGAASQSLADLAFDALLDAIVEGRMAPGEPIRQELIAARLGLSKIPLREALARLEREGLVLAIRNRGFIVAPLSRAEGLDIVALRLTVEPRLMGQACERAEAPDRVQAVAAYEALRRAGNSPGVDRLITAYRRRLYAPGGGPLAVGLADRMARLSDRYRIAFGLGRQDVGAVADETVLGAWIDGRREAVETACATGISKLFETISRLS